MGVLVELIYGRGVVVEKVGDEILIMKIDFSDRNRWLAVTAKII